MSLVETQISKNVEIRQIVKLVLKDKEYINKLEQDLAAAKYELQMVLGLKNRLTKEMENI